MILQIPCTFFLGNKRFSIWVSSNYFKTVLNKELFSAQINWDFKSQNEVSIPRRDKSTVGKHQILIEYVVFKDTRQNTQWHSVFIVSLPNWLLIWSPVETSWLANTILSMHEHYQQMHVWRIFKETLCSSMTGTNNRFVKNQDAWILSIFEVTRNGN